jgi:hypothetical protein
MCDPRLALVTSVRAEALQELVAYWDRCRGSAAVMPRSVLDPCDMPTWILPYLCLLDVLPGGDSFRYRLVGTVVKIIGREFTGETVEQYRRRHESAAMVEGYCRVVRDRAPDHYVGDLRNVGREYVTYERIALPMTLSEGAVDQILAGFAFDAPVSRNT